MERCEDKTPPADGSGSQPKPHLRFEAAWKHKTIRLSPQSPERVHAGKPSRKKTKTGSQSESSFFSLLTVTLLGEYHNRGETKATPEKTQTEICFHGTVTSVCSLLYLKALKQGMLETERVWFDSKEIKTNVLDRLICCRCLVVAQPFTEMRLKVCHGVIGAGASTAMK